MHCLLIHHAFASHANAGGTRHFELARHCADQGIEFTVIASDVDYLSGKKKEPSASDGDQKIHIEYASMPSVLHTGFVMRVFAFIAYMFSAFIKGLIIRRVNLVIGTSPPIFQAVSACLIAKFKRVPFLLEIRDLWPEFAIDMGVLTNPMLIRLSRWLESWLYRNADHLLVNSPAYRTYLIEYDIPEERISFIPNGVDTAMFMDNQDWTLLFPEPDSSLFHVAYTGALGMANDIDTIIGAAERLSGNGRIHFWLIGDGKERDHLENVVRQKDLKNITFTGAISKNAMPLILNRMDLCVATLKNIPMFKTTYPNKVFDYMAAGKPTLLAIDGVIREVVEAADAGQFSPPGDASALAGSILHFYGHPEKGEAMGQRGKKYVRKHFERKLHADQFYQLLQSLDRKHS